MKRLISLLFIQLFFLISAYCQGLQIRHIDFLVENSTDNEFKGVVWINAQELYSLIPEFDGFSFVVTTTHSPDLASDMQKLKTEELESQPLDENGDGKIEKIGVYITLKSLEKEVITVHIGEMNRILRIKGQYKNLCAALKTEDGVYWESDLVGYRQDNKNHSISLIGKKTQRNILSQITASFYDRNRENNLGEEITILQKSPGFGGLGIFKGGVLSGFDQYEGEQIRANGPLITSFSSSVTEGKSLKVNIQYTFSRESRWTMVEASVSGDWKGTQFVVGIPSRADEKVLSSEGYLATFAGKPALGLGIYVPIENNAGEEMKDGYHLLKLNPDKNGKIKYAFSGYWELEHSQNIVYPEEVDIKAPEVTYRQSDKRLSRILIRPALKINSFENFKKELVSNLNVQIKNKPVIQRMSDKALTYTEIYPPEAVKKNRIKSYKESLGLMANRVGVLAEIGLNNEGHEKFWEQSDPRGRPSYINPNDGWGNGYWVSMLWDSYKVTGDKKFKEWALKSNRLMLGSENRPSMVTGLDYWDASVRTYKETGDKIWRESALKVADEMYNATMKSSAGLIPEDLKSPDKDFIYVKVDAMICIPILFWAYKETGNKKYLDAGNMHASKTKEYLIEPNGVAYQLSWHHPETGELIGVGTNQGLGGNSAWARGQAWVLDGFADAFILTKDQKYADIFAQSVEWISKNLPADYVPWYDYDDQAVFYRYRDTSAPASSAYALLRMSDAEPDPVKANNYRELGIKIVNSLIDNYLTKVGNDDNRPAGMLSHQCYVKHFNSSGEQIWGSFNLMRTLMWLNDKGIVRAN
jgi:unsaturated chondroitin disaccharide hydrolase